MEEKKMTMEVTKDFQALANVIHCINTALCHLMDYKGYKDCGFIKEYLNEALMHASSVQECELPEGLIHD